MAATANRKRRTWEGLVAAGAALVVALAVLAGCGGGGDEALAPNTTYATEYATTTAAAAEPAREGDASLSDKAGGQPAGGPGAASTAGDLAGLSVAESSLDRKVISNASLTIEVERGTFQAKFDQAMLLADTYGGYIISSNSTASGDETQARSGTIAVRVPEQAFAQALAAAGKLGNVKSRQIETQDVTEEYVDLQARLANAQAQEKAFLALMDRAKTVDEILQVRQVLSQTQQEIEQLKGRLRFLDEHTSYSTLVLSLYETGVEVASTNGWGVIQALKDAVHAFVDSSTGILVGFAGVLPGLILLGVVLWFGYRVLRPLIRRSSDRPRAVAAQQPIGPQNWTPQQGVPPYGGAPGSPAGPAPQWPTGQETVPPPEEERTV